MKGLEVPIEAQNGRLITVAGEDQLKKILMLNLSNCDSANPFQDLGLDPGIVFRLDDPDTRALIRSQIVALFKRFEREGRARLANGSPSFVSDPATQTLMADVRYINLETTTEVEMRLIFESSLGGVAHQ